MSHKYTHYISQYPQIFSKLSISVIYFFIRVQPYIPVCTRLHKPHHHHHFFTEPLPLLHQLFYQRYLPQVVMGMLYNTMNIAVISTVFFIGKIFP